MRLPLLLLLALGGGPSCGSTSYLELEINSSLTIPDGVDRLQIRAFAVDGDELGDELIDEQRALSAGLTFPLVLVLEPASDTPEQIELHLLALRADSAAGSGGVAFRWQEGKVNRVAVRLAASP